MLCGEGAVVVAPNVPRIKQMFVLLAKVTYGAIKLPVEFDPAAAHVRVVARGLTVMYPVVHLRVWVTRQVSTQLAPTSAHDVLRNEIEKKKKKVQTQ